MLCSTALFQCIYYSKTKKDKVGRGISQTQKLNILFLDLNPDSSVLYFSAYHSTYTPIVPDGRSCRMTMLFDISIMYLPLIYLTHPQLQSTAQTFPHEIINPKSIIKTKYRKNRETSAFKCLIQKTRAIMKIQLQQLKRDTSTSTVSFI